MASTMLYHDQRRLGRERHFDARNTSYLIDHAASAAGVGPSPSALSAIVSRGSVASSAALAFEPSLLPTFEHHWRGLWPDADQGDSPMCTGFSGIRQRIAGPVTPADPRRLDEATLARQLYEAAVAVDQSEGRVFDGGATMLALGKAGQRLGHWGGYRWGYTLADFIAAIRVQPVLLGIDWYEGCDEPAPHFGVIRATGRIRGGHAILAVGANFATGYVTLLNTWGPTWGNHGAALLPFEDLEWLIADGGEVLMVSEPAQVERQAAA